MSNMIKLDRPGKGARLPISANGVVWLNPGSLELLVPTEAGLRLERYSIADYTEFLKGLILMTSLMPSRDAEAVQELFELPRDANRENPLTVFTSYAFGGSQLARGSLPFTAVVDGDVLYQGIAASFPGRSDAMHLAIFLLISFVVNTFLPGAVTNLDPKDPTHAARLEALVVDRRAADPITMHDVFRAAQLHTLSTQMVSASDKLGEMAKSHWVQVSNRAKKANVRPQAEEVDALRTKIVDSDLVARKEEELKLDLEKPSAATYTKVVSAIEGTPEDERTPLRAYSGQEVASAVVAFANALAVGMGAETNLEEHLNVVAFPLAQHVAGYLEADAYKAERIRQLGQLANNVTLLDITSERVGNRDLNTPNGRPSSSDLTNSLEYIISIIGFANPWWRVMKVGELAQRCDVIELTSRPKTEDALIRLHRPNLPEQIWTGVVSPQSTDGGRAMSLVHQTQIAGKVSSLREATLSFTSAMADAVVQAAATTKTYTSRLGERHLLTSTPPWMLEAAALASCDMVQPQIRKRESEAYWEGYIYHYTPVQVVEERRFGMGHLYEEPSGEGGYTAMTTDMVTVVLHASKLASGKVEVEWGKQTLDQKTVKASDKLHLAGSRLFIPLKREITIKTMVPTKGGLIELEWTAPIEVLLGYRHTRQDTIYVIGNDLYSTKLSGIEGIGKHAMMICAQRDEAKLMSRRRRRDVIKNRLLSEAATSIVKKIWTTQRANQLDLDTEELAIVVYRAVYDAMLSAAVHFRAIASEQQFTWTLEGYFGALVDAASTVHAQAAVEALRLNDATVE